MKTLKQLVITALLLAAVALQAQELDRIVAVVNEDVIVRSELEQEVDAIMAKLRGRGTRLPPPEVIERQVLERVINKRLQLQAAERLGIEVDDATLARAIDGIAAKNNLSQAQLRNTLESGGVSFESFREDTREQIMLARLQNQEVIKRISITDREVENFIERSRGQLSNRSAVLLQQILVATPDAAAPEEIQRAQMKTLELLQRLRDGADFAGMALEHSDGRHALDGGDLGWMEMSQVPSMLSEAARTLERGQIGEPFRSARGFHIIRMKDYKATDPTELITQTHARHILIKTSEVVSDQDARTRLERLQIRLKGGEDFASLARSHSDDTASAIKGGDLGWISPGDTVPDFEEQMDRLGDDELSDPFQSPFGWHLLQVLERRQYDNTNEMLKTKARELIRERKAEEATELWLRRLRDESYVEMRIGREEE